MTNRILMYVCLHLSMYTLRSTCMHVCRAWAGSVHVSFMVIQLRPLPFSSWCAYNCNYGQSRLCVLLRVCMRVYLSVSLCACCFTVLVNSKSTAAEVNYKQCFLDTDDTATSVSAASVVTVCDFCCYCFCLYYCYCYCFCYCVCRHCCYCYCCCYCCHCYFLCWCYCYC